MKLERQPSRIFFFHLSNAVIRTGLLPVLINLNPAAHEKPVEKQIPNEAHVQSNSRFLAACISHIIHLPIYHNPSCTILNCASHSHTLLSPDIRLEKALLCKGFGHHRKTKDVTGINGGEAMSMSRKWNGQRAVLVCIWWRQAKSVDCHLSSFPLFLESKTLTMQKHDSKHGEGTILFHQTHQPPHHFQPLPSLISLARDSETYREEKLKILWFLKGTRGHALRLAWRGWNCVIFFWVWSVKALSSSVNPCFSSFGIAYISLYLASRKTPAYYLLVLME